MERKKIQKALLDLGYSYDSMKSLMCGRAKPSMRRAITLYERYGIPLDVWIDIKSYLRENDTKKGSARATAKGE